MLIQMIKCTVLQMILLRIIFKNILPDFKNLLTDFPDASGHTKRAIEGRIDFDSTGVDNSYLYIEEIGGELSLTIWLSLFGAIMSLAAIKYYKVKDVNSVFSLALIVSVMLTGVFMRTAQLFPIWLFLSFFMGVAILWILSPFNATNYKINS